MQGRRCASVICHGNRQLLFAEAWSVVRPVLIFEEKRVGFDRRAWLQRVFATAQPRRCFDCVVGFSRAVLLRQLLGGRVAGNVVNSCVTSDFSVGASVSCVEELPGANFIDSLLDL